MHALISCHPASSRFQRPVSNLVTSVIRAPYILLSHFVSRTEVFQYAQVHRRIQGVFGAVNDGVVLVKFVFLAVRLLVQTRKIVS